MIYYLTNGSRFHLYYNAQEVIFMFYDDNLKGPMKTSTRWLGKGIFKVEHMDNIVQLLRSKGQGDRNIGLKILEQTLKVSINGEVEGHLENV